MIAAGLCLMGGGFAQEKNCLAVDSYWPSTCVSIPYSPSSVSIYQHDEVPAGMPFHACHAYTHQFCKKGNMSLFFVNQNGYSVYNCYKIDNYVEMQNSYGPGAARHVSVTPEYLDLEYLADVSGARIDSIGLSISPGVWDAEQPGTLLRMLDARPGEKDFYVAYGQWGWKWYLLPMRSVLCTEAVFDFEEKVLVEL